MSILLNALKKSEAQRQVGGPPDIHAPVDIQQDSHPSRHRWLPLILLTVSAAVIAWFGWQQYRPPETAGVSGPVQVAESEQAAGEINPDSKPEVSKGPAVDMLGASSNASAAVTNFPAKNDQEAEERKQRLSRSFAQFESEPQTETGGNSLADDESPADDSSPAEADTETDEFSELESSVNAIAQQETPTSGSRPESQRRASRSGSLGSDTTEQPEESEPISFWQVPQTLRDSMPEFRITVLVYSERPEDRFLVVNGVRLVENEELADGVTLDEIRRDGAVFRYRNYRFLVKG